MEALTFPSSDARLFNDRWSLPRELRQGLQPFDLLDKVIDEALTYARKHSYSVIPQYTDWDRCFAFNITIIIAVIAEFCGERVVSSLQCCRIYT